MSAITIKMLARELNLAISTVSRALMDSYEISAETKEKVHALARQLNYQPNHYASSLRRQRSKTIAVIIPEISNNFFSHVINGIEAIAQEKNYHVLIYFTHENQQKEAEVIQHLLSGRVDGILMSMAGNTTNIQHLHPIREQGIPIVFFDRICADLDAPTVTTDDFDSSLLATHHLMEVGCKKIAYLSISPHLSIDCKRMQGFQQAIATKSGQVESLLLPCSTDPQRNQELITNMLAIEKPDGIFASVEKLAIASYHACASLGLSIPADVKILSFSNLETASLLNPGLTTIIQPAHDMGKSAATVLFNMLEKRKSKNWERNTVIRSSMIIRRSTQIAI
ncbi:LacI family DNA-binding transcriptional regulator [Chitinophaga sp. sic0106]|uniref:LacI family DNA-binding transcriptional regulator n=1 Tax=Chitinophaga sp. sic0106 TaxID=2854785 RepID=UPI001C4637AF|nr:LacI family DNA-binding transcriptional regulator [Chitinophaga sp. sic0106]MBV7534017.1 LacI family transcriptional regulator [Chitinophaga sp. sic0106]